MSEEQGQRTPRTPEEIQRNNRAHQDGSGIPAVIVLGGAVVVIVLGLLWWLTSFPAVVVQRFAAKYADWDIRTNEGAPARRVLIEVTQTRWLLLGSAQWSDRRVVLRRHIVRVLLRFSVATRFASLDGRECVQG